MYTKVRLLPEQVENLKNQYNQNLARLQSINLAKNEQYAEFKSHVEDETAFGPDTSILGALAAVGREFNDAKQKLGNYELIEPNNSDIIGLGSTFEVLMNYGGMEESATITLVEVHNVGDSANLVSINSPLGKASLGKQVGDEISYMVEKRKFTGTVKNILKQKQKTL